MSALIGAISNLQLEVVVKIKVPFWVPEIIGAVLK